MATAKHRKPRTPIVLRAGGAPLARRAGGLTVAVAAAAAGIGLTAPAASADSVWDRVAACESSGNWSINTGNGFYGGLQFYHPTWVGFGGQQYATYAHQASKSQQIAIAQKVLAVQGPGAWPVCSVRAGLTRDNGGASYAAPAPPRETTAPSRSATTHSMSPLVRDGIRGPLTTKAIQRWVGTAQDGILGPITTTALQRKVGTYPDGIWGPNSQAALQDYLDLERDGSTFLNYRTVLALQKHLNANVIG